MAPPLLSVANLGIERGGRSLFADLSFALDPGDIVLVSGRNGAGKSSLLRALAGLLDPVAGRIDYGAASAEVRGIETIHYVGYEDALKAALTVRENLSFWAELLAGPSDPAYAHGPEAFGVAALLDLRAAYLSAGQRRRVALARMLLAPRPLWLLDEPLIALDRDAQAELVARMAAHAGGGGAILVASHQPLALAVREIDLARWAGRRETDLT